MEAGSGEMAQCLRMCAAPVEDLSVFPSTVSESWQLHVTVSEDLISSPSLVSFTHAHTVMNINLKYQLVFFKKKKTHHGTNQN